MSPNPFPADPSVPRRLARHSADQVRALASAAWDVTRHGVLGAADAAALVARFGLEGISDLMLLLLTRAQAEARPPISGFKVGAIALEIPSGDVIFGHNVEFPGTQLGTTLHAEGFLATRAFHRGTRIGMIALGEAHPCGHCRQFLSEFAGSAALRLIDPLGHELTLAQLYPWPFDPSYLEAPGAIPGRVLWPDLAFVPPHADAALLELGRRAHTPYSRCPAALRLTSVRGESVQGAAIESVAFNPSIGPLQSALVEWLARGFRFQDIRTATLAQVAHGNVDYARSTSDLLARIAPDVPLTVLEWKT